MKQRAMRSGGMPVILTVLATAAAVTAAAPAAVSHAAVAAGGAAGSGAAAAAKPTLVYSHLRLPNGEWAQVWSDGLAEVYQPAGANLTTKTKAEYLPLASADGASSVTGSGALPAKGQVITDLLHGTAQEYAANQVVVVYRQGASASTVNRAQAGLGVDRSRQMFSGASRQRMAKLRSSAQNKTGHSLLDFPDARVLHVTKSSVPDAVAKLRANPNVAFAEPNWTVAPTDTTPVPIPAATVRQARAEAKAQATASRAASAAVGNGASASLASSLPDNFALTSSAQSMLNRPADDVIPAYTAIAKQFGQLPGQGEIITNVSLGTLDDASAASNPSDPCSGSVRAFGPTTEVIDGQRYINWPSMPLIPTYTASSTGVLDPTGETCGNDDPQLTEVGLDFSMMAPLPHNQQRAGETGSGLTDLLGIAPGASYRLVIPQTQGGAISDVDAAISAAANQSPRPDVITISLGFGLDSAGYPSRYLEDDPMTEAVIASVTASGIVVSVSAGDGLRTFTNAAIAPSGGSAPTDVTTNPSQVTDLNDVADSTAASVDLDSGAMDVGGSTLNDIFANPPDNPANKATSYLQAYPATRYDGFRLYSSGFGSRVNISAPGDNVVSFEHTFGGADDAVTVVNEGGTSASAPEAAAAAAIVLQVARLTGDNALAGNPRAVRSFLESTGTSLPAVKQSDVPIHVGPQIDVGRAVEQLLTAAKEPATPGVARVAVSQRQQSSALGGTITTTTDPTNISLAGRLLNAWITISPDWTGLTQAKGVTYRLASASGGKGSLAATPWARLQPSAILAAAGLPLVSATSRDVPLAYTASEHGKVVATASFALTFGPSDGTVTDVQAPIVPSVVTGKTIPVRYDISELANPTDPTLVVSNPGRVDPSTGLFFRPAFTAPLTTPSGTINVPVSALPGGGIYGFGIQQGPGGSASVNYSTFTFIRVSPTGDVAPLPPTLSAGSAPAGHVLEIPLDGSFQVHYDVRNVPGATGAIAEFSAPGPNVFNSDNMFNNPNGSQRDANGHDSGSVAFIPLRGAQGTTTLNGGQIGLEPTMIHSVRVFATDHGKIVGEASGVSTIMMDGVAAADGGVVADGFGVDPNGTDGLLTSNQVTASGAELGSIETFDQDTGATHTVVSSSDVYGTLDSSCAGIYGADTGVVQDSALGNTLDLLNPVSGAAITGTWTPPASIGTPICAANTEASGQTAMFSVTNAGQVFVFPVDFATGATGNPVNITAALQSFLALIVGGIAYDPATGHAYVAVSDLTKPNAPITIIDVDLNAGTYSTFSSAAVGGQVFGIAVDPATNKAVVGTNGGFAIDDLTTHTGTFIQPGGPVGYMFPVWIPGTQQFLLGEQASPDFVSGPGVNNNSLSSILNVDENGNILQRDERFDFFNVFLFDAGAYVQPGAGSKAFTIGPSAQQLHPFTFQKN